ncbi:hypothetical protein EDD29_6870 [Actinocorallia herbida]|uniref:Secreted protein n=1 Tax=Actinocorallia herbida TaxID=58109 RepID=A0A3N1D6M1_9ACTN|nr:hypothetical protein [Actinocorallia herbida]ROO89183.1 hypothetical protein EDD29_6870 [Actinocorallia herbida]
MPRLLVLTAAVAALALTGCTVTGSDGGLLPDPSTSASASGDASPESAAPESADPAGIAESGGPQPVPAASSPTAVMFADAREAVTILLRARIADDKTAALTAAGPRTVEKVFATAAPLSDELDGCVAGSEHGYSYAFDCYRRYEGGSNHYLVDPYPATGWRVVNYEAIAD